MSYIQPVYYEPLNNIKEDGDLIKSTDDDLDFSAIIQDTNDMVIKADTVYNEPKEIKPKQTRKRGSTSNVNTSKGDDKRPLLLAETNDPYSTAYRETDSILKGAIAQIDMGLADLKTDIDYIRNNRTLKRKYDYLSMMQGTMGNFIGNKIAAAREMNNTITKCNELELKRIKELNINASTDDNKAIMDMYDAFINTPIGINGGDPYSKLGADTRMITSYNNNIIGNEIGGDNKDDIYSNYYKNMTPGQHMMLLEDNPNIKQVVIWDKSTGARSFEIMDMSTMTPVPNVEKYDAMFLENTYLDEAAGIARNNDLNETYPLIVVGNGILNEY